MTKLLDKLAMEVSVWGEGRFIWFKCTNGLITAIGGSFFGEIVVESQWLQRRKELINEPRDSDAPEGMEWKAQDSDGAWYWHKGEPTAGGLTWLSAKGLRRACQGKIPAGHNWKEALKEVKRKEPDLADQILDHFSGELPLTFEQFEELLGRGARGRQALKHGAIKKAENLKIDDVVAIPLLHGIVTGRVTRVQDDGFVGVYVDSDMSLTAKAWYFLERPL